VGLVLLAGIAGLAALVAMASGGPGFLTKRRTIDVVFRDGKGIRVGNPVRVAGIDAGRVTGVELAEFDGILHARVRLAMSAEVADRLRQDVQITIESGLTGQSLISVVSSGRSKVALVPGQVVQGVESSFFDPILDQVGLGPVERKHISHMVSEVRQTLDEAAPKLRAVLSSLEETSGDIRQTVAVVRPRVESIFGEVEELARSLDDAKLAEAVARAQNLIAQLEATVSENRPALAATLKSVQALASEVHDLTSKNRPQIDALIAGLNLTRTKLDAVLANAEVMTDQGASILTNNRADIDRTLANVRDATGYGLKLVQKLYGNPFYLSPFYKPRPEDIQAEEIYDAANTFLLGAKEFSDAMKSLQALRERAKTQREQDAYNALYKRAWELAGQLSLTQQKLSEGLRNNTPVRR
jgi:phospholipid/cholesterol/gamma-HCH transport system substrate-binding protein